MVRPKNDKSLDGMLAQPYALCSGNPVGDFTGQIVAFAKGKQTSIWIIQEAHQSESGAAPSADRYAGETFKAVFQKRGINHQVSEVTSTKLRGRRGAFQHRHLGALGSRDRGVAMHGFSMAWQQDRPGEHDDYSDAAAGVLHLRARTS